MQQLRARRPDQSQRQLRAARRIMQNAVDFPAASAAMIAAGHAATARAS